MPATILRRLRAALFTALAACGFVASANATVYAGAWDPPYGDAFPNLGWRGEVLFDVPATCGVSGNFTGVAPCAPGSATFQSAFVGLYLLNEGPAFPTRSTLTFAPSSMNIAQLAYTGGELLGLVTSRSNWVWDSMNDVWFALQFAYEGQTVAPGNLSKFEGGDSYSGPVLWYKDLVCVENYRRNHHGVYDAEDDHECDRYRWVTGTNDLVSAVSRPVLTFAQVPEPGTLALVLAAGLVGVRLRRGRRGG